MGGRRFQASSATTTARNDTALKQNAQPAPMSPTIRPPRAGPTARLTLKPALLSATPPTRLSRSSNSGTMAWNAGMLRADPVPIRKDMESSTSGVIWCMKVSPDSAAAQASMNTWVVMSSLRRSRMSARAPAESPSSSTGSVVPVSIRAISRGEAVMWAICHFSPTLWIWVPTLEAMLAIQIIVKSLDLRGSRRPARAGGAPFIG